ncbi:MlaC/ttg2D family ABC transporter substrate-binding protein [Chitinibacter tainanensis]|jgi:phospholipid transport system substrate-binding protein|uniref:MlaC/ttg2D family ABC transporter substrate-binding protein n=1 Tax=Chitinibacter tainanensis TaxID=230667 RepID=UPI00041057FA|nr:ABC transporter substrate-binding protein [Chitinibacter tainanensis]
MIKLVKQLLLATSLSFVAHSAIASDSPEQIVRSSSKDVLEIIKKNDKDPAKTRDLVDARLSPLADYKRMTALATGQYWKSATTPQQEALTNEFRAMLVRTYLSALTVYKNAQINIKGTRAGNDADEQTVRTEVSLPGQKPIPLDFNFEKNGNEWKVYDINVDGISFINNHRNQFGAVIRKDGIDGLIKQLAARNNAAKQGK